MQYKREKKQPLSELARDKAFKEIHCRLGLGD